MNNVTSALLYLRLMTIRNAIVSRITRLKQPKYFFGALAGLVYFYFAVLRRMRTSYHMDAAAISPEQSTVIITVAALLFMIVILLHWIWPRTRAALTFNEAEIAFLFPAPISNRALIHYRLANVLAGLLFTAFIFSLFSGGTGFLSHNAIIRLFGWWIVLATISLHSIGSSFTITALLDRGITSLRRLIMVSSAIMLMTGTLVILSWHTLSAPRIDDLVDANAMTHYLVMLLSTAPLSWILLPAKWVIQPALANDIRSFLIALLPASGLLVIHYIWVLRAEVSFADASIAKAEKRAAKVAAMRTGKLRIGAGPLKANQPAFDLSATGRPELAFLWKNLLASASYLRLRPAFVTAAVIVIGCQWITSHAGYEVVRSAVLACSAMVAGYVLLLGPMMARQDLRNDLPNIDILKTYPLHGWQVVLGEILTPTVILTVIFWLLLLAASLTLPMEKIKWLTSTMQLYATLGIALVTPLLCAIQLLVLNTAAVLFPAWMQTGQGVSAGIEVMGQRLLFVAGLSLAIVVALLPATVCAALGYLLTKWLLGSTIAMTIAVLIIVTILIIEIVLGIEWLGRKFERFDLSAELRT